VNIGTERGASWLQSVPLLADYYEVKENRLDYEIKDKEVEDEEKL
jgi:hypothetical protein